MPPRVLIITATIGEGHDLPARTLAAQLRDECPGVELIVQDGLEMLSRFQRSVSEGAPRVVFFRQQWVWDLGYGLFARLGPTRRVAQRLLHRTAGPGMLELIDRTRPDVIVSTWPQSTEVLGALRRSGRLAVPVCAAVTDIAGLAYWASPGVDLHLITHPESVDEVRAIAGERTRIVCVHGLTAPEFLVPRDRDEARRALGLPAEGGVVLVSGGGWGVGDVVGAVDAALSVPEVAMVVALCGRNDELRGRIRTRWPADPRVRAEGFTERMGDWMAAAGALVHSTGGLTILEAHIRGCSAISYGWGRGHLRPMNAAFVRHGLAEVVTTRPALVAALRRALAERRAPDLSFARLPSAASEVLALAGG